MNKIKAILVYTILLIIDIGILICHNRWKIERIESNRAFINLWNKKKYNGNKNQSRDTQA